MIESWLIMKSIALAVFLLSGIYILFNCSKKRLSSLDMVLYLSFFSYCGHVLFSILNDMNIEIYHTMRFASLFFLVGSIFAFSTVCSVKARMKIYKAVAGGGAAIKRENLKRIILKE